MKAARFPTPFFAGVLTIGWLLASWASAAPVKVQFWHTARADAVTNTLKAMAQDFNKSQSKYEVSTVDTGDYGELQIRLVAAARANSLPTMALVDNVFFGYLAESGELANLDGLVKELPKATIQDFYSVLWECGEVNNKRVGLPFSASTLLLFYNINALKAKNVAPPKTWDDYIKAVRTLTTRGQKGAILLTDAWGFSSYVSSRGGSMLTEDGKPDFANADAVATLVLFQSLIREGVILPRDLNEMSTALVDFLRTRAAMVVVPSSVWRIAYESTFAFPVGAVPLPGRTVAGEAQMVIFKDANSEAERGAFEFWQYMVRPENVARWVENSAFLPIRRSAVKLLSNETQQSPPIRAGLEALERSYNLPRSAAFQDWRRFLEESLEKALKGNLDAKKALGDAQKKTEK
jgi:ABC-type glycerol-3-phosphate transport system substrate-binding protein